MIISGKVETTSGLTPNQKAVIRKALKLSALNINPKK
jgi:hypothetical protein